MRPVLSYPVLSCLLVSAGQMIRRVTRVAITLIASVVARSSVSDKCVQVLCNKELLFFSLMLLLLSQLLSWIMIRVNGQTKQHTVLIR